MSYCGVCSIQIDRSVRLIKHSINDDLIINETNTEGWVFSSLWFFHFCRYYVIGY